MSPLRRLIACTLVFALGVAGLTRPAQAALIATQDAAAAAAPAPDGARGRLLQWLDRADVVQALQSRGVAEAQARERVAALSDDEAAALLQQVDQAPAGGDVLGTVVFIFVLLLITDILGFTKVFPFTRSVR